MYRPNDRQQSIHGHTLQVQSLNCPRNNKCYRSDYVPTDIHRLQNVPVQQATNFNPLNAELNPICCLLALLGAHHFLHVSRTRVKLLTFRLLMSYIYMEHPFLMFLDHTQRRTTVGRTYLDERASGLRPLAC